MEYPETDQIKQIITSAKHVVVLQADNPDADSLGSALALEQILGELGKQVSLYCAVDMPTYLRYLQGWDRVQKELPASFDAAIIVDASTMTLFERLTTNEGTRKLMSKPVIVLDHHEKVKQPIEFANVSICDQNVSSTGELVFSIAKQAGWPLDELSGKSIMAAILGDTQGLSNSLTQLSTYRVMISLIELGVNRSELEERRRQAGRMPESIFRYKSELMSRTQLHYDGQIATVVVPQHEINEFSPIYNPAALVQFDMLQIDTVKVSIVFKQYDNGRVTAAIRANYTSPIAGELAEALGGGGHAYASGFKVTDGKPFDEIISDCLSKAFELLNKVGS